MNGNRKIIRETEKQSSYKRDWAEKRKKAIRDYKTALAIAKARKKAGQKVSDQYIETLTKRINNLRQGKTTEKGIERAEEQAKILRERQEEYLLRGRALTKEEREELKKLWDKEKEILKRKEEAEKRLIKSILEGETSKEEARKEYESIEEGYLRELGDFRENARKKEKGLIDEQDLRYEMKKAKQKKKR